MERNKNISVMKAPNTVSHTGVTKGTVFGIKNCMNTAVIYFINIQLLGPKTLFSPYMFFASSNKQQG